MSDYTPFDSSVNLVGLTAAGLAARLAKRDGTTDAAGGLSLYKQSLGFEKFAGSLGLSVVSYLTANRGMT
jgi:hypothetical protein